MPLALLALWPGLGRAGDPHGDLLGNVSEDVYLGSRALMVGMSEAPAGTPQLEDALASHGFDVTKGWNLDREQLTQTIQGFLTANEKRERLLLYVSGAGQTRYEPTLGEVGLLGASPTSATLATGVWLRDLAALFTLRRRHVLVVVDACVGGLPVEHVAPLPPHPVTVLWVRPTIQFVTACDEGESHRNGLLPQTLAEALSGAADVNADGLVMGSEVGAYLYQTVTSSTSGQLHPRFGTVGDEPYRVGDWLLETPLPERAPVTPAPIGRPHVVPDADRAARHLAAYAALRTGRSGPADQARARRHLIWAAESGDPTALALHAHSLSLLAPEASWTQLSAIDSVVSRALQLLMVFDGEISKPRGRDVLRNADAIIRALVDRVDRGDTLAIPLLAQLLRHSDDGLRVEPEWDQEAVQLLEKAAKAGDPLAMVLLAEAVRDRPGVAPDDEQALQWLQRAAALDYPLAFRLLADAYFSGRGTAQNVDWGEYWMEVAAHRGDAEAMWAFARDDAALRAGLRDGPHRVTQAMMEKKHWRNAAYWVSHALDREPNDPELLNDLALALHQGNLASFETIEAVALKSAEADYSPAFILLAYFYGERRDHANAVRWLRRGAEVGISDEKLRLALYLDLGWGVRRDSAAARRLREEVAASEGTDFLALTGEWFESGNAVAKDLTQARAWYADAAEAGSAQAALHLARMHEYGIGGPQDLAKNFQWNLRAAELGNLEGMYKAGRALVHGRGGPVSFEEGIRWLTEAARRDYPEAQTSLRSMGRTW